MTQARGTLLLALAGLLFGSTFLVVQDAVTDAEPTPLLTGTRTDDPAIGPTVHG